MTPKPIRGFSLVESVVATAIIGVTIVATGLLLQRIPVDGREVRDQDLALKIARAEIETLRASGYSALGTSGSFSNSLLTSLASSSATVTIVDYDTRTKKVTATVSWRGTGLVTRSMSLTTLIAQNSKLP